MNIGPYFSADQADRFTVQKYRSLNDETQSASTRGAGAILFSSLVYKGWKFPPFLPTESDERYLFDLEVRLYFFCSGPDPDPDPDLDLDLDLDIDHRKIIFNG